MKSFAGLLYCLIFPFVGYAQPEEALEDLAETSSGIWYHIFSADTSRTINPGDHVLLHLVREKMDGETIFSTYDLDGQPVELVISKPEFNGDIMEGITLLGAGDSGIFYINSDSIYRNERFSDFAETSDWLRFKVKIIRVHTERESIAFKKKHREQQLSREIAQLNSYFVREKLTPHIIPGPLFFETLKNGIGQKVQEGDTIAVHYTLKLLSGRQLESSYDREEPFIFPVGAGNVIDGWDMLLPHLYEGQKVISFIPSAFAYGAQGAGGQIPPDTILIFEIEVLEILD